MDFNRVLIEYYQMKELYKTRIKEIDNSIQELEKEKHELQWKIFNGLATLDINTLKDKIFVVKTATSKEFISNVRRQSTDRDGCVCTLTANGRAIKIPFTVQTIIDLGMLEASEDEIREYNETRNKISDAMKEYLNAETVRETLDEINQKET